MYTCAQIHPMSCGSITSFGEGNCIAKKLIGGPEKESPPARHRTR